MFILLLFFALLLGPPSSNKSRVALVISPRIATVTQASKGIKATLTIEPDARNRAACLVWESENELGSRCWEFDEIPFPRTTELSIRLHTPGYYEFILVLEATDKRYQTALQSVEVH